MRSLARIFQPLGREEVDCYSNISIACQNLFDDVPQLLS
jgi:hypothetical protein